jgi:hypothetical protein
MSKLILISVIIGLLVIPARAARDSNARRGLKKTVVQMLFFYAFYAFALAFLWGRC